MARGREIIKKSLKQVVVFDGAMGTMLQRAGLPADAPPELWNLENPDEIFKVQRAYVDAGAQILTTNTFGASRLKLAAYNLADRQSEIIHRAVQIAKDAAGSRAVVAGDIGPLGVFLQPFGELTFDRAYQEFFIYAKELAAAGADLIIIETMTDLLELKAAVLAARDATDLPIIASFSFDEGDSSVTGTPPDVYAAVMNALAPDAFGTNCGNGIEPVVEAIRIMRQFTDLPILGEPNAGLPKTVDGVTVFPATPGEMADAAVRMWEYGANLIGSCCGSTPEHTAKIAEAVRGKPTRPHKRVFGFFAASRTQLVRIAGDEPVRVVGERINPSGRKKFREKLRQGDIGTVKLEVIRQERADLLDVCVAGSGIDERQMLPRAVAAVVNLSNQPLFIDSTDPEAIECALKFYPGLPVINSIPGKSEDLERLLPLARRWGANFVALAMDDDGIPADAEGRFEVIRRIVERAQEYGIPAERIIADPVVLPVSADSKNPAVTLEAIELIAGRLKLPTVIGLSNVSYGLPARGILNATFLVMAIERGLSAVIANPLDERIYEAIYSAEVLVGRDERAERFIAQFSGRAQPQAEETFTESLRDDILRGNAEWVPRHIDEELKKHGGDALAVLNEIVIPAIREIGDRYERREIYLPQVIASAEATMKAIDILRPMFPRQSRGRGKILLATVYGDVHDIGKNLVRAMLESYGFEVTDLGKNVPPEKILDALRRDDFLALGLSALMTTTLPSMEKTVRAVREEFPELPVFVGGAAVSPEFAESIGAIYAENAVAAAKLVERLSGE